MRPQTHSSTTLTLTLAALLVGGCSRSSLWGDPSVGCRDGELALTRAFPTAVFLLDRSESMNAPMYGDGFWGTRWDALGTALAATLPTIDSSTQIGALLFPASANSGNCSVKEGPELTPALGNVAAVLGMLENNSPGGATPTHAAINSAATALLGIRTQSSARALVLATDGGPDCNMALDTSTCRCTVMYQNCEIPSQCLDDTRTIDSIAKYRELGLPTYVIGIQSTGDSSFSDVLDAMAVAGGRPQSDAPQKYYAARSPEELNGALTAIGQLVGACVYITTSVPGSDGSIVLSLNGVDLSPSQWSWQDRDNGELVLAPDVCAQIRADVASRLMARVTCVGQ